MKTIEELISQIKELTLDFVEKYDMSPTDIVMGPEEFDILRRQAELPDSDTSSKYGLELAVHWIYGMRIRLAMCEGMMVGVLTAGSKV